MMDNEYKCIKKNKRCIIVDNDGNVVYTLPDFLRNKMHSRKSMIDLADNFTLNGINISAIMNFETSLRPVKG